MTGSASTDDPQDEVAADLERMDDLDSEAWNDGDRRGLFSHLHTDDVYVDGSRMVPVARWRDGAIAEEYTWSQVVPGGPSRSRPRVPVDACRRRGPPGGVAADLRARSVDPRTRLPACTPASGVTAVRACSGRATRSGVSTVAREGVAVSRLVVRAPRRSGCRSRPWQRPGRASPGWRR